MPLRRRSSRLRGATPKSTNHASSNLESLAERDETPTIGPQSTLDAIVSSPLAPRTPATAVRPKPAAEEMHPSKAHHSTTNQPDSGLKFGFVDVKSTGGDQPSGITQQSPSKTGISSTYDFRFARPGPQLGPEAQRMMEELREEALRIKAKLAEEKKLKGEDVEGAKGRKIAQPKGKVGRYSEVHMEEFKKMDSIEGHPSAFRAQPGRFTPSQPSLKRTQSKAKLDDREEIQTTSACVEKSERLENTAPVKRARKHIAEDTSSARPVSRDTQAKALTPNIPRSHSTFFTSLTTPTQASLARAAAIKQPSTNIPTLSKSPSKLNLNTTPRKLTKSATSNNITLPKSESKRFLRSPSKFERVRSILRHVSGSSKKPSTNLSSIPSFSRSPSKPNIEKALPPIPATPGTIADSKIVKHISFTPDTMKKHTTTVLNSPSPLKSGIPRSASKINLGPKPSNSSLLNSNADEVHYPSLADHPHIAKPSTDAENPFVSVRPLPKPPRTTSSAYLPPSVPGTFTFRSDHTISFGASPKGFGSSPGQASLRQVRQSIFPNIMPGSFPITSNKENTKPLPSVPHGMSNKKRRRVEEDDETEDEVPRSPKKHKAEAAESAMLMAPRLIMTPKSKIPSPAKKGVLSVSRLNMLARPKMRK